MPLFPARQHFDWRCYHSPAGKPDDGGVDLFVHVSKVADGYTPDKDDLVSFDVVTSLCTGKPQAQNAFVSCGGLAYRVSIKVIINKGVEHATSSAINSSQVHGRSVAGADAAVVYRLVSSDLYQR